MSYNSVELTIQLQDTNKIMKKMDKRILVAFSETFLYSPLISLSNIKRSKKLQLVIHKTTHTRYSGLKWKQNEKKRGKYD